MIVSFFEVETAFRFHCLRIPLFPEAWEAEQIFKKDLTSIDNYFFLLNGDGLDRLRPKCHRIA